jgi:hypothetical protein
MPRSVPTIASQQYCRQQKRSPTLQTSCENTIAHQQQSGNGTRWPRNSRQSTAGASSKQRASADTMQQTQRPWRIPNCRQNGVEPNEPYTQKSTDANLSAHTATRMDGRWTARTIARYAPIPRRDKRARPPPHDNMGGSQETSFKRKKAPEREKSPKK